MTRASADPDVENLGVEVWRGGVDSWECDRMGHWSARFYIARAMEGLVVLAAALGMPKAFAPGAGATLLVRDQHIRFLREARAGTSLHMRAAVVALGENEARLLQVMVHSATGQPAATFQTIVGHVTAADGRAFPWPAQARERAASLMAPVPDCAAFRSLSLEPFETAASLQTADALGLGTFGTGAFGVQDCDGFGRMRPELFLGRITDGIALLADQVQTIAAETAKLTRGQVGAAALEYRLTYHRWPRAGDRLVLRSGLSGVDERTVRKVHWLLDPAAGEAWATAEAVVAPFDLERRKLIALSPEAQARIRPMVVAGLKP